MEETKEEERKEEAVGIEHTEDLDILQIVNSVEGRCSEEENRNDENDRNEHPEDLDILEIVNSVGRMRSEAEERLRVHGGQPCTIYQVSKILRQVNEKCYEPRLVSVGPYHRDKEELKPMEEKKSQYVLALLSRNPELRLDDFVKAIKELETEVRKCYSESISLRSKEFVEMMVFDGCFLVEIFLRIRDREINDDLLLQHFITHDMLLLENQLPFFVLESIFSLVMPIEEADLLKELIVKYCFELIYILPLNKGAAMKESYHHVLDMFRHQCLPTHYADMDMEERADPDPNAALLEADPDPDPDPNVIGHSALDIEVQSVPDPNADSPDIIEGPSHNAGRSRLESSLEYFRVDRLLRQQIRKWKRKQKPTNSGGRLFSIHPAEELQEAGIKLERKVVEPAGSFLDVKFDKRGTLKIPYLYFYDGLQTIFQNLIAYEQCHPKAGTYFSGYALFMDHLINTAKDVRILRHAGILEHGLGSDDELARHFNEMCRGIFFTAVATHLYGERIAINDYCRKMWPTWRANLMRNYFNSPWAILSLIAAVVALLLTGTQTVFSTFKKS